MKLHEFLTPLEAIDAGGDLDVEITSVTRDSREAGGSTMFVAIAGGKVDGHDLTAGLQTAAVVVERDVVAPGVKAWVRVADTRRALAFAAAAVTGWPSRAIPIVGVTGTNGKTTITTLLHQAAGARGVITGRIGTTGVEVGNRPIPSSLTTPEAPLLHRWFREMADAGAELVAMEVSSIGIVQRRVDAIGFHVAVFSNLTHDHLDFHGTMEAYADAKAALFRNHLRPVGGLPRALLCADDPAWRRMDPPQDRWLYGFDSNADVRIERVAWTASGMIVDVAHPLGRHQLRSPLVGRHNAQNLVAAFAAGLLAGQPADRLAEGLAFATGAPGRLEVVPDLTRPEGERRWVVVDYAHSPDALSTVIASLRASCQGQLIVLFGCGGDRDRAKRPEMGRAALAADRVVITSDNPRSEDPGEILHDILQGVPSEAVRSGRVQVIEDRRAAIRAAVGAAQPGDVVLLAGKGHEDYQEIGGIKHPFDDRLEAREALAGGRASTSEVQG